RAAHRSTAPLPAPRQTWATSHPPPGVLPGRYYHQWPFPRSHWQTRMNRLDLVEKPRLRDDLPDFTPGDTVRVHVRVAEAGRERIRVFQGVVIRRQGGGFRETFTVRKISFGIGVER